MASQLPFAFSSYRDTSREAWKSVQPILGPIDSKIVEALDHLGGATVDQLECFLDLKHQTVSAQVRHLFERGLVADSGRFGFTRSGRRAIIWEVLCPRS